jgi:hypothetical protein
VEDEWVEGADAPMPAASVGGVKEDAEAEAEDDGADDEDDGLGAASNEALAAVAAADGSDGASASLRAAALSTAART